MQEHLMERANKLGIRQNFVFAGPVDREMIAAMDLIVHTSLREGLAS